MIAQMVMVGFCGLTLTDDNPSFKTFALDRLAESFYLTMTCPRQVSGATFGRPVKFAR